MYKSRLQPANRILVILSEQLLHCYSLGIDLCLCSNYHLQQGNLFRGINYCSFATRYVVSLISLINVKSRLLISKNSTLHKNNPPSTFIDVLDFFHPPLHVYCIYILVFSKKSHPPRLFQPPRLLILQLLHPLHVYSNLHGY